MRTFRTGSASALLLMAHACASAQDADPPPIQQVQVSASAGDRRAQSTTTAIIVNRDELLRHGDASLADVLKRQPGITLDGAPGKPATIRMRGLGAGYAAILLNGVPAPAGFALESLSPDLIDRVEILRAATAETSGQAVGGTINIVLRRAGAGRDDVKIGSAFSAGHAAPTFVGQHSGRRGALAYTLAATVKRSDNVYAGINTDEGRDPDLLRHTAYSDRQVEDTLELAPRLSWQPASSTASADTVSAQGYVRKCRYDGAKTEAETTQTDSPTAFPHARSSVATAPLQAYADLAWTRTLADDARLTARLSGTDTRRGMDFLYRGLDPGDDLLETHRVLSGIRERELTFSGSWRRPLWTNHALAAGWEVGRKRRAEYRREHQADARGTALLDSDEDYGASVDRSALFVQDEWEVNAAWSVYLGLRREDLHTTGAGSAHAPVDVRAGVWSPIVQTLFKPAAAADGRRDAFRFAVSRTYKAPNIAQLMPRRYTVDNNNSATNPDQQGNPNLHPELALGIDVAWERYFSNGGMVSVSAFQKRIRDVTLDRIGQSGGVWIAMPANQGHATVLGVEFEARRTYGALALRVNAARNWSHVEAVPGPDNRIAGQPAWSGNIGLDYAAGRTLDAGATLTYRGRVATRSSASLEDVEGVKCQLDLYALWRVTRTGKLRLSVSDLLHPDYAERTVYLGDPVGSGALARTTDFRLRTTWRVVWEQAL
jgi:outer membrane receptor protein involved in Fe transport